MKKILSILVCVCVLLSAMVFTASAADGVSISFADKSARTSYSTSQQVWEQNGIKVTNDKGASTTNVGDYANPGRFYKNSTVTIEYPGMTSILIDSVTYSDNDYAGAWVNSFDTTLGTATANDGDVTITFNSAVNSVTFEKMAAQGRAYTITVYTDGSTPPVVDEEEDKDDTPTTTTPTVVDSPVAGTAYKFGMVQGNLGKTLFLTGEMDGFYMGTTENVNAAADVYLEETTGGHYIYSMVNGAKKYLGIVDALGTDGKMHTNAVFTDAGESVFNYNDDIKTFATKVGENEYGFGTRNDKNYTTISPSSTEYTNNFVCQFYTLGAGEGVIPPAGGDDEEDNTPDVFDPTGKTAAEIVNAAYALAPGAAFEKAATLTGVITSVDTEYSSQFQNVTVTIKVDGADENKPIKCYRIKGDGADVIAVGDKITVTGIIKNYVHSSGDTEVEFDAGSTLDSYVKADGSEVTPPAGDKEEEKEPELGFGVVANPVAGTAYKFGMVQGNLGKTLFLTGEMDGFYMATTENADEAADVYLEETTGGYYIYAMVNGAKKYLGIVEAIGTDGNTHINAVFTDTADSVFTYNDTVKTFVTTVGDKEYGFGTRNDREYATISPSSTEYTDNFVCQFYGMTVVDNSTTSPSTGDSAGALVAFAMVAAAALVYTSKKR